MGWLSVAAVLTLLAGCSGQKTKPIQVSPEAYRRMVTAFPTGVLALVVGDDDRARVELTKASKIVPQEPAPWVNLAILDLKQNNTDGAEQALQRAQSMAPPNSRIELLAGVIAGRRGRSDEALTHLRRAVELDGKNLIARYTLVQELNRQPGPQSDAEARTQLEQIVTIQPGNLLALIDLTRTAAASGNADLVRRWLRPLQALSGNWPSDARSQLKELVKGAGGSDPRALVGPTAILHNYLKPTAAFHQSYDALHGLKDLPPPLSQFLRLPPPRSTAATPDTGLTFSAEPVGSSRVAWARALMLAPAPSPEAPPATDSVAAPPEPPPGPDGPPTVALAAGSSLILETRPKTTLPLPGPAGIPEGLLDVAWNNDYRPNLALVGASGLRLLEQGRSPGGSSPSSWIDVTARSRLPAAVTGGSYIGAWAMDIELDGDLDIVLGSAHGSPRVLRNNADGTWGVVQPFSGVAGTRDLVWTDLDGDGVPDVAMIDGVGKLIVFRNDRAGNYSRLPVPAALGKVEALSVADANRDGLLDLVVLAAGGSIRRLSYRDPSGGPPPPPSAMPAPEKLWEIAEIVHWDGAPADGSARLIWADLDNNGALDLIASGSGGSRIWLGGASGDLTPLAVPLDARVLSVVELNGDGRLDLIGVSKTGTPVRLINRGIKNYRWQVVRPRSDNKIVPKEGGNDKINSFGVGGEAELWAGLLGVKQPITSPALHFGLGEQPDTEVSQGRLPGSAGLILIGGLLYWRFSWRRQTKGRWAALAVMLLGLVFSVSAVLAQLRGTNYVRLIWPNGQIQGEFGLKAGEAVMAKQRLTGSCPWLFADDGHGMRFVTDILWKSPLGLRINAQDTAGVSQTRDWVKVRGDQLQARNGFYNLCITAELWETDFFDTVSLMTVDHPLGTELLLDERFAIPQPALALHPTGPLQPVAHAWDDRGRDVTDVVRARDGRYLDGFGLGAYQGITRDHYVEVELPDLGVGRWALGVGAGGGKNGPTPVGPQRPTPNAQRRYLVASGWIYPTDSSINVAISQGKHDPPRGLSLEVRDARGRWVTARKNLGFPAGKNKTVLIELDGLFPPGSPTPRRLRLRTNLEIYWDSLAVAIGLPGTPLRTRQIAPAVADLRSRGFSAVRQEARSSPELPDYNQVVGTSQQWLDLTGFYTRFGDVRELLSRVDDRYVIMNAGDEIRLRFPAPPPPPPGWTRDYVFVSDGWDKDGNFNTGFSETVLPLPSHDRPDYRQPPGRLEDDPVYRRHSQDWQNYHTRYVTPREVRTALWRIGRR